MAKAEFEMAQVGTEVVQNEGKCKDQSRDNQGIEKQQRKSKPKIDSLKKKINKIDELSVRLIKKKRDTIQITKTRNESQDVSTDLIEIRRMTMDTVNN